MRNCDNPSVFGAFSFLLGTDADSVYVLFEELEELSVIGLYFVIPSENDNLPSFGAMAISQLLSV